MMRMCTDTEMKGGDVFELLNLLEGIYPLTGRTGDIQNVETLTNICVNKIVHKVL